MKTISIIIPIYNVQDYLPRCLDTVFAQESKNLEVILVNDGSTDQSVEICKDYQKRHPDVIIVNKKNGGLSDARNVGTSYATGEYIYYLDSDDWLAPAALETLYDFAKANSCEVVQGGFYYAYEKQLLLDERYVKADATPFVLSREGAMRELIQNNYVKNFAWGKLYRTDIARKYPFPKGKFFEDSFWQHRIIHECKRYGVVPTPLYYYRQREGGISGVFSLRNMDLLIGNEERLGFMHKHYPDLELPMAAMLWKLCYQFNMIAQRSSDSEVKSQFANHLKTVEERYQPLLHRALRGNMAYLLSRKAPSLLPFYQLCGRAYSHFFGKSLTSVSTHGRNI